MTNAETKEALLVQKFERQTQLRGAHFDEYQTYLSCADNGKGGDITRNGAPLLTFEEWLAS